MCERYRHTWSPSRKSARFELVAIRGNVLRWDLRTKVVQLEARWNPMSLSGNLTARLSQKLRLIPGCSRMSSKSLLWTWCWNALKIAVLGQKSFDAPRNLISLSATWPDCGKRRVEWHSWKETSCVPSEFPCFENSSLHFVGIEKINSKIRASCGSFEQMQPPNCIGCSGHKAVLSNFASILALKNCRTWTEDVDSKNDVWINLVDFDTASLQRFLPSGRWGQVSRALKTLWSSAEKHFEQRCFTWEC